MTALSHRITRRTGSRRAEDGGGQSEGKKRGGEPDTPVRQLFGKFFRATARDDAGDAVIHTRKHFQPFQARGQAERQYADRGGWQQHAPDGLRLSGLVREVSRFPRVPAGDVSYRFSCA